MRSEEPSGVHDSRDWSAKESTDFAGGNRRLRVTGEVQVTGGNLEPLLTKAVPQGISADILLLNLATRTVGDLGTDALEWKPVSYEERVEEGRYRQVQIGGQATVDVEQIIS